MVPVWVLPIYITRYFFYPYWQYSFPVEVDDKRRRRGKRKDKKRNKDYVG
jgi:hypothetical protein